MTRFGLGSDSDSDSEASTSKSLQRSPTYSQRSSRSPGSRTTTASEQVDNDDPNDPDYEEESELESEAPPRASLMRSDDDDDDDDTDGMDETRDDDEGEDTRSTRKHGKQILYAGQGQRKKREGTYDTSVVSSNGRSTSPELDENEYSGIHSSVGRPSPVPSQRRRLSTTSLRPTTGSTPWPQKLKLEPKRVAVMQASFFHQPQQGPSALEQAEMKEKDKGRRREAASISMLRQDMGPISSQEFSRNPIQKALPAPTPVVVPTPAVDPAPFRKFRKYTLVNLEKSITHGKEGSIVDPALMFSRSFRIGWGPRGQIVHAGSLYGHARPSSSESLNVDKLRSLSKSDSIENESAIRLLKLQLDHTPIYADSGSDIPFAVTHPELRFLHFVNLFSSLDQSPEADLWRLGQALFDEIEDLMLPDDATSEMVNHITEIRRRDRVETWLEEVIKGDVEENLREVASKATTDSSARRIFALLSGHQIERACEAAVDLRDLRLATLLAQAGGDDEFREDIYLQLAKWREYRVDAHIAVAYRRVYELLCGNVGLSEGVAPGDKVDAAEEFHVGDKLDWKRTFGLHLWYGTFHSPLATSVKRYQSSVVEDSRVSPPVPSYIETRIKGTDAATLWKNDFEPPTDPLFEFLKLYSNPTHSLEETLWPRNFGPSPLDYRLPWHLYILFSRVLRKRDFEDRIEVGDEEENGVKGNSVRADLLTISYATQLELAGTWEWAAFVLLHLELPEGRVQAIRDLLARNVEFLDEEHFSFLTITLKIPPRWIYSAQAIRAKYNGDVFAEYKMLLAADEQRAAHNIVVTELAPEAIIRSDMGLLRRLLDPFNPREVAEWESGGKIYLDYADCLDELYSAVASGDGPVESLGPVLLDLIHTVPRLGEKGRGMKLKVCVTEMQSRLTVIASSVNMHLSSIKPSGLQEADRLVWLQGANTGFLQNSLRAACS